MYEIVGDIWDRLTEYDAICITTNGVVKNNGEAVMGKGIALQARIRYPQLPSLLTKHLKTNGNTTALFRLNTNIFTFPTKHNWKDKSSLSLIEQSAHGLITILNISPDISTVLLPRPGCENGGLYWAVVKSVIEPILDNRITVITLNT